MSEGYKQKIIPALRHEFIVGEREILQHIRTGQNVSQFEVEGQTARGKPIMAAFTGDRSGWLAIQMLCKPNSKVWARLCNNQRIRINLEG